MSFSIQSIPPSNEYVIEVEQSHEPLSTQHSIDREKLQLSECCDRVKTIFIGCVLATVCSAPPIITGIIGHALFNIAEEGSAAAKCAIPLMTIVPILIVAFEVFGFIGLIFCVDKIRKSINRMERQPLLQQLEL